MEDILNPTIGEKKYQMSVKDGLPFQVDDAVHLSLEDTDILYRHPWYEEGCTSATYLIPSAFANLKQGLTQSVAQIIEQELGLEVSVDFSLESYHQVVTSQEDHGKVLAQTSNLFAKDMRFPLREMLAKLKEMLGFELTATNPKGGKGLRVTVHITPAVSNDNNAPHMDVYGHVDEGGVNLLLWIPIVPSSSSVPLVLRSRQLAHDQLLRTSNGALVEGHRHRVRMPKEWGGSSHLELAKEDVGQALFFSGYPFHDLAASAEPDITRVAMELRLFKSH